MAETVGGAMLAAIEDGTPAASPAAIERERERARAGMALLRLLLSGGDGVETAALSGLELVPTGWIA